MTWDETIHLKIALLNAENLFLMFDQKPTRDYLKMDEVQWHNLSTSVYENKTLKKTKELAQAILEINPDILMLCEVGGPESLKNFNDLFLNSNYSTALIEGNSDRNIDVCFLIRKNLPFYFDLFSNKNRPINYNYPQDRENKNAPSEKFARDVLELKCFKKKCRPTISYYYSHSSKIPTRSRSCGPQWI